jgi:hypothetical protein
MKGVGLGISAYLLDRIIGAIKDARIDERRGFGWHTGTYPAIDARVNDESADAPTASCARSGE